MPNSITLRLNTTERPLMLTDLLLKSKPPSLNKLKSVPYYKNHKMLLIKLLLIMRTNKTPMLKPRIRETKKTSSSNKSFICSRIKFQAGQEENIDTLVIVLITKNISFKYLLLYL